MARTLLVLDEAVAILEVVGGRPDLVQKFREQAARALQHKARGRAPDGPEDAITVNSGYGTQSKQGHVEMTVNDVLTQMSPAKAREIGLMLIEAAEAAISDEVFNRLLDKLGMSEDVQLRGRILLDLREIRQGTRGTVWPT